MGFLLRLRGGGLCGDELFYNPSELEVCFYCRRNESTISINKSLLCFLLLSANTDISLPFSVTVFASIVFLITFVTVGCQL